jgi:3-oxoacyl-[acyl-carrier protein] reductase
VDFTVAQLGGLDAVITVVGGIGNYVAWQPFETTPDDVWDTMFEVNVRYVFRLLRDVLKQYLAQGTGGSIVSVGSMAAVMGMPHAAAYGASKAALSSMAKSVAAEYGRRGIRMNVVNSGAVMTEALRKGLAKETTFESVPVGRPAVPSEIAELAVFLSSSAAAYITGQSINVDGGMTSRGLMRMGETDSSMTCHCVPAATVE